MKISLNSKNLILFLLISATISYAQVSFNRTSYTWSEIPDVKKVSKQEQTDYNSVLVFSKIFCEYEYNTNGYFEKYYTTHTCRLINDERALEANNKIYIAESNNQKLINLKSRIIQNGKVINESGMSDLKTVEQDQKKYQLLAINGLVKGSMIETITQIQIYPRIYDDEYLIPSVPLKYYYFQMSCPKNLKFSTKSYNGYPNIKDTLIDEKRYYVAYTKDPKIMNDEKYSFTQARGMRLEFQLSENDNNGYKTKKWPEIGREYFDNVYAGYEKSLKDVNKLLKKIPIEGLTEEQKIIVIENYLKSNISVEESVDQEFSIPNIIKNKYASKINFTVLFLYCLDAAGIQVDLILTCDRTDKKFDPDFNSSTYLDEVLFSFPKFNKLTDPTSFTNRYGKIKFGYLAQKGLFIKSTVIGEARTGLTSIKTIPLNDPKTTFDNMNIKLSFNSDLDRCNISYKRSMQGYSEQGIREAYYLINEEKRKEVIKGLVTIDAQDELKSSSLENYDISNPVQYLNPIEITGEYISKACIENAGENVLLQVGKLIGPQEEMYQEKPRQNPIDLYFAHNYNRIITVEIPDGYKVKGLDKLNINKEFKDAEGNQLFGFISSYKLNGKELTINCSEYYNGSEYELKMFESFKSVINAAADFNKISLLISK